MELIKKTSNCNKSPNIVIKQKIDCKSGPIGPISSKYMYLRKYTNAAKNFNNFSCNETANTHENYGSYMPSGDMQ